VEHKALIDDLRQKSSERIRQIWSEAEARVEELRRQKQAELERRQAELQGQLQDEMAKVAAPILHEASRMAIAEEDEALRRLADRLAGLAKDMLPRIREQEYPSLMTALADELPAIPWERVRVNPQDTELARTLFPESVVEQDESICGGFVASGEGGRYLVINTLEGRLEKGWPAILPILIKKIIKDLDAVSAA